MFSLPNFDPVLTIEVHSLGRDKFLESPASGKPPARAKCRGFCIYVVTTRHIDEICIADFVLITSIHRIDCFGQLGVLVLSMQQVFTQAHSYPSRRQVLQKW
jgi:hypothetical protein